MKNLCLLLAFLSATTLFAQSATFETAIEKNLQQISSKTNVVSWTTLSLSFTSISNTHPDQWLGHYYTAFAYRNLAGTYSDQTLPEVAKHLDKAQSAIDKAKELSPDNAEILALQGFIYVARIWESPFMNGGHYGRKISKIYQQIIELDATNPRAYYLKGPLTFHTPRFVGGGKERAKPYLETALSKFDSFSACSAIYPNWGLEENTDLYLECGGAIENIGKK